MCVWPLMLSRARAACAAPVEVKKGGKQMEKTNREYMAEPARVERTLQRFTKMTLHELKAVQQKKRNYAEWCMDGAIAIENLDREKAETMSYMDIICFLHNIWGDDRYAGIRNGDGTAYPSDLCQDFTYKMLARLLLDVQMKSVPIRLFMELPLKAFYGYLERISRDALLSREYRMACDEYVKLKDLSTVELAGVYEATIKDVLRLCNNVFCMAWIPTQMELENYSQSIMSAYRLVERLLVKSFRLAFPEQFCMDRIRTRYAQDHKTA